MTAGVAMRTPMMYRKLLAGATPGVGLAAKATTVKPAAVNIANLV
jgi:hypothetical protein